MNVELNLIAKILLKGSMLEVMDRGITEEFFYDSECKKQFKWLLEFYQTYSAVPSVDLFEQEFKGVDLHNPYPKEPVNYYIDCLKEQSVRNRLRDLLLTKMTSVLTNPLDSLDDLKTGILGIVLENEDNVDVDMAKDGKQRKDRYENMVGGVDGFLTPWPILDEVTRGIHNSEYWAITGRPYSGKSWVLTLFGAKLKAQQKVLLICSLEMGIAQFERRFDCLEFDLSHERFRNGVLTNIEKDRYFKGLAEKDQTSVIITNSNTLSVLAEKIKQYKADVLMIDGAYLLVDEAKGKGIWERTTNISRSIKRMANELCIPIITVWQLKRDADGSDDPSLSDINLSDAIGQDSVPNELIFTSNGLEQICDLEGKEFYINDLENLKRATCVKVGQKQVMEISFRGFNFECSENHKVYVYDNTQGAFVWKLAKNIIPENDYLIRNRCALKGGKESFSINREELDAKLRTTFAKRGEMRYPKTCSRDLGKFFGGIIGDGSIKSYQSLAKVHCGYDEDYAQEFLLLASKLFGVEGKKIYQKTVCSKGEQLAIHWNSQKLNTFLNSFLEENDEKALPLYFLELCYDFRLGLLEGLLQSDGGFKKQVRFVTSVKTVATNFCKLCHSLGVRTYTTFRENGKKGGYRINLNTRDLLRLDLNIVGEKKKDFENLRPTATGDRLPSSYVKSVCKDLSFRRDHPYGYLVEKGKRHGTMSVESLEEIERLKGLDFSSKYCFAQVDSVTLTDRFEEMYDPVILDSEDKRILTDFVVTHNSDVVFSVINNDDLELRRERRIVMMKHREGELKNFTIDFDPNTVSFGDKEDADIDVNADDNEVLDY